MNYQIKRKCKSVFIVLVFLMSQMFGLAQQGYQKITVKSSKKSSGISILSQCSMVFDNSKSEDGADVYTGECNSNKITYSVICINLLEPKPTINDAIELAKSYLDYLKEKYFISTSAGYNILRQLNNNKSIVGVSDYWQDSDEIEWKVTAWTNRKSLVVLMANSSTHLDETSLKTYLEGVTFP